MNVLFVVNNLSVGGAGRVVSRLATQMHCLKDRVIILITSQDAVKYNIPNDVKVYHMNQEGKESRNPIKRIFDRAKVIRTLCKSEGIDVVYAFLPEINIYSILAGMGQKWKTIISERNDPHIDPPYKRVRALRTLLYPFADGIVFQTQDAKKYFSERVQRKSTIIFNPISNEIPKKQPNNHDEKLIVAAGRLTGQKNYPMMIDACKNVFAKYPEYRLEIYGDGEEMEQLYSKIKSLELENHVKLMGHTDNLWDKMKTAQIYLLSSDYEGMSNSLMEAMVMGLAVISTDHPIGGAKELIQNNKNGILVKIRDHEEMANAIIKLIEYPKIRSDLSNEASKIREQLAIETITEQWKDFAEKRNN